MNIQKVKQLQDSFVVNDTIFVPNDPKNSSYQEIQQWIAKGGIVEVFDFLQDAKAKKINALNAFHESDAVKRLTIKVGAAQTYIRLESDYRYLIDEQIGLLELRIKKGEVNPVWNYQNGITLPLNLSQLSDVRIYIGSLVDANFNAKRNHEKAINALNSIEAVNAYDFTANYRLNQILPFSA